MIAATAPGKTYDVVVAGGGAAGVSSAIGAAQTGARTLLIERYGFLGGAATNAAVLAYCGLYKQGSHPVQVVAGVADLVRAELRMLGVPATPHRNPATGNWIVMLECETLKLALDRVVVAAGAEVRLHSFVTAAERAGGALQAIHVTDHAGTHRIAARAFVDASGEGDLAKLAGVPVIEGGLEGHPLQAASLPMRIGGVDPSVPLDRVRMAEVVALHNTTSNHPFLRPDGGYMIRLPASHEVWWLVADVAAQGLAGADLTAAEMTTREACWHYLDAMKRHIPGFANAYIISTGPQIGIRETRHPAARLHVTRAMALAGARHPASIALAAWPMENHHTPGKPTYESIGGDGSFQIPLDALRADAIDNLWFGGRLIGADASAFGSVRVMGTAFATGHAAGVAAAVYAEGAIGDGVTAVQSLLKQQGAMV